MRTDEDATKRKGAGRYAAVIAAAAIAVMLAFSFAFPADGGAEDDAALGDTFVDITGKTSVEIEADIQNAIDSAGYFGTVRIEGTMKDGDATVTIKMHNYVQLLWRAVYAASCSGPALVIDHTTGTFEMITHGSLTLTNTDGDAALELKGDDAGISLYGGAALTVNGKITSTSNTAHIIVTGVSEAILNGDITTTDHMSFETVACGMLTINGNIEAKETLVYSYADGGITVNGDINAENGLFVSSAYGSKVTINGNAEVTGSYAYISININAAVITMGGIGSTGPDSNCEIFVNYAGTFTVNGDINMRNDGDLLLYSQFGCTSTVIGNITSRNYEIASTLGGSMTLKGDAVFTGSGYFHLSAASILTMDGNIEAEDMDIRVFSSIMTVNGNIETKDVRLNAFSGSILTVNGNITATAGTQWLMTADDAKIVIDGDAVTNGNGARAHNGGIVIIMKELTADPGNYISVDALVLTKDDISEENTGPYGGREYTNGNAVPSSYVYVSVPADDDDDDDDNGDVTSSASVMIMMTVFAALLLMILLLRKRSRTE
jgi:hypothetical protein